MKYKFASSFIKSLYKSILFTACVESCIIKMTSFFHKEGRRSMTIYQLECFIAVAEELNFSAAAERLFTTQPAITYQINALEK